MTMTRSHTTPIDKLLVPTAHAVEPSAARATASRSAGGWMTETLDKCVSLTAKRLAAALAAAVARPSLLMRCATGLAREGRIARPAGFRRPRFDTALV
jgi:hypothetical protein